MVAITDVAARAGVSTATVSRHLAGHTVRSAERIQAAIEELSYTPSRAARALKSGVTHAVAVVVPDITNPFFASVVKGVESVAREGEYSVFLSDTDEDPDLERRVLAALANQVDGVILAPITEADLAPKELRSAGVPVVFIDRTVAEGETYDSVLVDNVAGAASVAQHLVALGHERLAVITGPLDTTPGRERYEGFIDAAAGLGVEVDADCRRVSTFRESGGYQEMLALLALPDPPTAVFSGNNAMTVGALKALDDMRVPVPSEMSVVGFDDLDLAPLLAAPLSVVRRSATQQGVLAMRLLLQRLRGVDSRPRSITLSTELVLRASTAPPGGGPSAGARS